MKRYVALGVALALVVTAALFLILRRKPGVPTLEASGTVEATQSDLGFQSPGRIVAVTVREGDPVRQGELLARLDTAELVARKAAAESQLASASAVLSELEAGSRPEEIAQSRAAESAAAQKLDEAQRDLARAQKLYAGGAVSREALDQATTTERVASATLDQAREQLRQLIAGPRRQRIEAQQASVKTAKAQVEQVEALLQNAIVRAPYNGTVTIRHREDGEIVQAGMPVLTIMNPSDRWVRIYIPENRIGEVSIGQPARITSDSFKNREFAGRVIFISEEAEFTPRNVQTKEERVKLVYRVRVRIVDDPELLLKPGVPADVALVLPAPPARRRVD